MKLKRVILETPYAGAVERNLAYARAVMLDSLRRNEAPFLSHLLYPQVLDDLIPEERKLGIEAGFAWGAVAESVIVYKDLGISRGMEVGLETARARGLPIEFRSLPGW
jgi:hypothetical protein